ncbi:MAG: ricin-type beta-trefoil lectin domain protein, partial [Acidobacteriota bacterium]|nr:ricin-type beta-trefoil lectin domain protein [Acidobacteriota bacterium]
TDFGFAANSACRIDAQDLWTGTRQTELTELHAEVGVHDTAIWRITPSASCGRPARAGTIIMVAAGRFHRGSDYTSCLASTGSVEACVGTASESWTATPKGALRASGDQCLAVSNGKPVMESCRSTKAQRWRYKLNGNLIGQDHQCLSAAGQEGGPESLEMQPCGHNLPNQIWSLPN